MKNSIVSYSRLTFVLLAAIALHACSDKSSAPVVSTPSEPVAEKVNEPVVREEVHQVTATVEAIDAGTREIKLKGENGSSTFIAGPEVVNFDNIHVGDKVTVGYYEALAAELKKKGTGTSEPIEVAAAVRAPVGGTPAASAGRSVSGTVKIESYDTATDTVTFVNSGGVRHTVAVQAQNMKEFARTLKPGDEVELTYVEAIAVEVVPGT